jgi:5-methylcytosine-specific restriction endonuclease McrA
MKKTARKTRPLRLDSASYEILHRQVLERDEWRCQFCGSMLHLQVHHLKFRSRSGNDEEQNLITLCAQCHNLVHRNVE